jgi:hypothetical protein
MKITSLLLTLSLCSASAFADVATIKGTTVSLSGSMKGATSEIFKAVSDAYSQGFYDANGAHFFDQLSTPNRVGGRTTYVNKNLTTTVQSGITLSYSATMKAKKGEAKIINNELLISGKSAELLKSAMSYSILLDNNRPVGMSRTSSASGKIVCTRVVYPKAPTNCTIKL